VTGMEIVWAKTTHDCGRLPAGHRISQTRAASEGILVSCEKGKRALNELGFTGRTDGAPVGRFQGPRSSRADVVAYAHWPRAPRPGELVLDSVLRVGRWQASKRALSRARFASATSTSPISIFFFFYPSWPPDAEGCRRQPGRRRVGGSEQLRARHLVEGRCLADILT